jgi:SAM-dependent methyltransferase
VSAHPTPFGRAVRDEARGERTAPLVQHTPDGRSRHPIRDYYLGDRDPGSDYTAWLESWLSGPLADLGAGAGRDTLYFQRDVEAVAVETDPALVETCRERGVERAVGGDMFDLRATVPDDRFASALSYGTQACLAGSMDRLERFLDDLAAVTTGDATAVVDAYDPGAPGVDDLDGVTGQRARGLAGRELWFTYEGECGPTLEFELFSPARLREAAADTPWTVAEVYRHSPERHYSAALAR